LFEAKKHCWKPSNNVFWEKALLEAKKHWLNRKTNVLAGKTMFQGFLGWKNGGPSPAICQAP
jgi:hypothetical protein